MLPQFRSVCSGNTETPECSGANRVDHRTDEHLAIADLAGACGGLACLDDGLNHVVVDHHLDADLGGEVHDVGRTEVRVLLATGAAKAPELAGRFISGTIYRKGW